MKMKFKWFLINYASAKVTDTIESNEHLEQLTDDFLKDISPSCYFTVGVMEDYCDYINERLGEDRHFYCVTFNDNRYTEILEDTLRELV